MRARGGRGHGGRCGRLLLLARADPARRRGHAPSPAASRRWPSSRCCVAEAGPPPGRVDLLSPPQRHRRARPGRQGPARCASGRPSRLPIILQGLGGRSKVDVPGAGWEDVAAWIDEVGPPGGRHLLAAAQPPVRPRLPHRHRHQPLRRRAVVAQGRRPRPVRRREAGAAARPGRARRDAPRRRAPQHRRCQGLDAAAAALEGGRGRRGGQARPREVPAAHHRRHRHRARRGARRRHARPGRRRGARRPSSAT